MKQCRKFSHPIPGSKEGSTPPTNSGDNGHIKIQQQEEGAFTRFREQQETEHIFACHIKDPVQVLGKFYPSNKQPGFQINHKNRTFGPHGSADKCTSQPGDTSSKTISDRCQIFKPRGTSPLDLHSSGGDGGHLHSRGNGNNGISAEMSQTFINKAKSHPYNSDAIIFLGSARLEGLSKPQALCEI